MFGWEFPPRISGGLGTACYGITKGLAEIGAEIIFVMPKPAIKNREACVMKVSALESCQYDAFSRTTSSSSKFKLLKVESRLRPYGKKVRESGFSSSKTGRVKSDSGNLYVLDDYGTDMVAEAYEYGRIAGSIAKQEDFDIIHCHDWMTVPAGIEARRLSGRPCVFHVHALEFDRSGENIDSRIYEIERLGLEKANQIISVSGYTKRMIVERYGINPDRVSVVHNAVMKPECGNGKVGRNYKNSKIVLFLGRVTFQKGPDYFIEAAVKVLKAVPGAVFVMAGTGDMLPDMIEKVARLRMGLSFRFTGFLGGDEVERIYLMSDVFVMPSVSEPFGITPLEAMARGIPVIISKQSGVSEIVRHALKVDFWDVNELADGIISLLTKPALVREMTKKAGEELEYIHWKGTAGKIMDVYRRLCV